ncbi:hypothetical protein GLOIN_2v1788371 [Rhizophagus irregularis DAOM 181602=DAOM 197198]|uniref:Uncharacterized protein n=1 Tax=Rhizophagus irregularis (strain DAOM 181602 / DAOM 197198 / MUCL 43194) TaxID=747089 RepID=A0A2P4P3V1_RHIID|nr:hypothetical protein GLOIN_2v1788371 [Rhizophagus irregularis DAOM 181602=DAOM 197198]POG60058.1 hypothetical protein GLOIN_2v1788371 [Rhizophagus irregularis DAOM 181602=DAOM 197198]GET51035.1 hypothetical protein GLOIN_2v1788371 [Rhizophagus irregularis DAOM 181602=DAOM 197198]|eukprot:XP_025166924.1 hypothetical protein GLOIN_2v1788371 [Rhizophagus irregularis DAOM 181602=DAOM 197198]
MSNNNYEITKDDVVEVFCKSNTKKIRESGLNELEIYKSGRKPKFGKLKEFSGYILADLIVRERLTTKAKARVIEDSWYYWVHRK